MLVLILINWHCYVQWSSMHWVAQLISAQTDRQSDKIGLWHYFLLLVGATGICLQGALQVLHTPGRAQHSMGRV